MLQEHGHEAALGGAVIDIGVRGQLKAVSGNALSHGGHPFSQLMGNRFLHRLFFISRDGPAAADFTRFADFSWVGAVESGVFTVQAGNHIRWTAEKNCGIGHRAANQQQSQRDDRCNQPDFFRGAFPCGRRFLKRLLFRLDKQFGIYAAQSLEKLKRCHCRPSFLSIPAKSFRVLCRMYFT